MKMYKNKKVLAFIPARGGSKGIKDKNIVDLYGQPLIAYSINVAKNSKYIDEIIVSTDSEKIADVAKRYGATVPFVRPDEIARDTSTTLEAVLHAIEYLEMKNEKYDALVLLQPTQPLRTEDDVDGAIEKYFENGEEALVSVSEVNDNPILIRTIAEDGKLTTLLNMNSTCRRQDMPVYYRVNGCIYVNKISEINENTSFNDNKLGYIMKKEHSVDIDDMKDVYVAEYYLKSKNNKTL